MSEKKNLVINCDVLDTRSMKEEDYAHYEQIVANADIVIVSEASKSILARLPVTLNHDKTIELPEGAPMPEIRTINGSAEITASTPVSEHVILTVSGALRIHPGAGDALRRFDSITINGVVECPESLAGCLGTMNINGAAQIYPDDCILLKRNFTLDEFFPVRAKADTRYYARCITFKSASVDVTALAKKNVRFACNRFIVPEELVETAAPLFDEQAECVVVPRGMTLLGYGAELSEALVRKHGGNLFVYGGASVDKKDRDGAIFAKLERLIVRGTLTVTERQEAALAGFDAEYDELEITKGRCIENVEKARVDAALMGASPDGVKIVNAGTVVIAGDLTTEAILEKLALENVGTVECAEEQESAVAAVSVNVGGIGKGDESKEEKTPPMDPAATIFVNADRYVL